VQWDSGEIWMLDQNWRQLVAYPPGDGEPMVLDAPAEALQSFRTARTLAHDATGRVFVFDQDTRQVLVLDRQARPIQTIRYEGQPIISAHYHEGAIVGSTVTAHRNQPSIVRLYPTSPPSVSHLMVPDSLSRQYAVSGSPGLLVAGSATGSMVALGTVGQFLHIAGGSTRALGRALDTDRPWVLTSGGERRAAALVVSAAYSARTEVTYVWAFDRKDAAANGGAMRLLAFDGVGGLLGEVRVPGEVHQSLFVRVNARNGNLLMVSSEPVPHLVELEVIPMRAR
jgi:hypothetical protein